MNNVNVIGNLTRDPELRHTPGGTSVCSLRIAVNDRKPDGNGGYTDYAHYFDVTVWGNQGETCAQYLAKGRKVAVHGKLEWREWQAEDGSKRSAVQIVAFPFGVDFLTPRDGNGSDGAAGSNQFVPTPAYADDDIPF